VLRWHALFTKPRHEWRVADALQARDVEVFVPAFAYHGKRGNVLERPFFPRYIFARLDWESSGLRSIQWTPGLTSVVTFSGEPATLADEKVDYLRHRLGLMDGDAFLALKPGERVRVKRGPFADIEATFDGRLNGEARVAILLRILGRQTRVILNIDDIERTA